MDNYHMNGSQRFSASLLLEYFEKLGPDEAREQFKKIYSLNKEKHRREIDGKALGDLIRERIEASKEDFITGEAADQRDPALNEFCLSALEQIENKDLVSRLGLQFVRFLDDLYDELNNSD